MRRASRDTSPWGGIMIGKDLDNYCDDFIKHIRQFKRRIKRYTENEEHHYRAIKNLEHTVIELRTKNLTLETENYALRNKR